MSKHQISRTKRAQIRTFCPRGNSTNILNATEARSKLYTLIDEAAVSHQPVIITGKRANAALVSEEDWNAISETIYLLSIPGMRKSIKEGIAQDTKNLVNTGLKYKTE